VWLDAVEAQTFYKKVRDMRDKYGSIKLETRLAEAILGNADGLVDETYCSSEDVYNELMYFSYEYGRFGECLKAKCDLTLHAESGDEKTHTQATTWLGKVNHRLKFLIGDKDKKTGEKNRRAPNNKTCICDKCKSAFTVAARGDESDTEEAIASAMEMCVVTDCEDRRFRKWRKKRTNGNWIRKQQGKHQRKVKDANRKAKGTQKAWEQFTKSDMVGDAVEGERLLERRALALEMVENATSGTDTFKWWVANCADPGPVKEKEPAPEGSDP